jgi:hypothetical protein
VGARCVWWGVDTLAGAAVVAGSGA